LTQYFCWKEHKKISLVFYRIIIIIILGYNTRHKFSTTTTIIAY